jgi:hypothetical protein
VAQVRVDEDAPRTPLLPGKDGQGVVRADLPAEAAKGALLFVDLRKQDARLLLSGESRPEEQMGVRLLDVTIEELDAGKG